MKKQTLYQVNVETREGRLVRVGPALMKEAAELLLMTIKEQIALGREKEWSNPHLAQVLNF